MRKKFQLSGTKNQAAYHWREWDFFREHEELSVKDTGQTLIAYDYELVRESEPVTQFILNCSLRETIVSDWITHCPHLARWAPNLERGKSYREEDLKHLPLIPSAVCLARWFPQPWLCGPSEERRRIVELLGRAYGGVKPLRLYDWPLAEDYERLLLKSLSEQASLYGIVIDRRQSFHKLIAQFKQSLLEIGISPNKKGTSPHRYEGAAYALGRMGSYRLWRLPLAQRKLVAPGVSSSKLSRAVAPIRKDFRERNYLGQIVRLP